MTAYGYENNGVGKAGNYGICSNANPPYGAHTIGYAGFRSEASGTCITMLEVGNEGDNLPENYLTICQWPRTITNTDL